MLVHSEERPFHCNMCGNRYKRSSDLTVGGWIIYFGESLCRFESVPGFHGTLWAPQGGPGTLWALQRGPGTLWAPQRVPGTLWAPQRVPGTLWTPQRVPGPLWAPQRVPGNLSSTEGAWNPLSSTEGAWNPLSSTEGAWNLCCQTKGCWYEPQHSGSEGPLVKLTLGTPGTLWNPVEPRGFQNVCAPIGSGFCLYHLSHCDTYSARRYTWTQNNHDDINKLH